MERKVNKLENSHVEVVCTVDEESWKNAQATAFKKLAAKVTVPGFRQGKAPENLVKSKVDQVKVMNEAIDSLLPTLYKEIIDEDGIKPFTQPKVDVTKLSDKELEIKFVIVTEPEVELGKYKDLDIGKSKAEVTEKEVQEIIDGLLAKNATLVVVEREAKLGDTVVIDFEGKVDGKLFDGGSSKNYELSLGSHSFIPGFEEQLVGHKAGEHVDVNVKFPEQYTEELKGKDAVFACDVHEVKEKKLPELNDEFVKDLNIPQVGTIEELKAYEKAQKLSEKEKNLKGEYFEKLLSEMAKTAKVSIPDEIIDSQTESRREDFAKRMSQSGLTMESYLQILGQTQEQFDIQLRENAAKEVKNYLLLEAVATKEGLGNITEADIEFEMAKLADQYKMTIDQVKKALEGQLDSFKNNIKMTRVEAFLYNNNK